MVDDAEAPQRDSRVLVLSQRRLRTPLWHATQLEMEDVLVGIEDVDLLSPLPAPPSEAERLGRRLRQAVQRRTGQPRRSPPWDVPLLRRTPVRADHDLFFAVFHHSHELAHLQRVPGWRERCRTAACLLVEQWSAMVEEDADYLDELRRFDLVYVFNPAVADALLERGVRAVRFLPTAVDALAFAPSHPAPRRVVDVYTYGRTSPGAHRALVEAAARTGLTYLYDTTTGARVVNHVEHRALMASVMQRSRFFLAWTITDSPERRERTGGDQALSTRYFEGAAGGAVMVGSRPAAPEFDECFPWPDAVVPAPYDGAGIEELLRSLGEDHDRVSRIRADNVRGSLLRHDWAHRWRRVLQDVGAAPSDPLLRRLEVLEDRAALVSCEADAPRR